MYWNRVNLVNSNTLVKLCEVLNISDLLFRPQLDPIMPNSNYYVPTSDTLNVRLINDISSQEEYLAYLSQANIYIAPRPKEGIGLSFLEALASGCTVIAINFPTMNEYIQHHVNGILLPYKSDVLDGRRNRFLIAEWLRKKTRVGSFLANIWKSLPYPSIVTANDLDVGALVTVNLRELGDNAREEHYEGYNIWNTRLAEFADFLLS
jgi:glycosyltransferase involved in cell wall biosynthesis